MCGIGGIVYSEGSISEPEGVVRRMIAAQGHRGPDGQGFHFEPGVALGHCRLAIIDLSKDGFQPMSDSTGQLWITFNGEIFNYVELGDYLTKVGYRFRSRSDTEVLLKAYSHWGRSCVDHLRGMFAFAIWDGLKRELFAARDRLGIKPFHYFVRGSQLFAFASELKALLPLMQRREVRTDRAREYLALNLLDHIPDETMWRGLMKLAPGHTLVWNSDGAVRLERFWSVRFNDELHSFKSQRRHLVDGFREILHDSVTLHLRSDVPAATCLSGGLDSSSIVCVANRELRRTGVWNAGSQQVFSACFEDPALDERPYIDAVVRATGCVPHFTFPNGDKLREDLRTWLWHQEEPVGGTGTYAHFCVARLAREHGIKVLLDGQGADEQLAGYRKFIPVYLKELLNRGEWFRAALETIAFFSSPAILRTIDFNEGRRYLFGAPSEVAALFAGIDYPSLPMDCGITNSLARRLEADLLRYSLPVLLRYEDRNTMAFGIEARVPFVDHVVVEWLASLPADLRLERGWTKRILREALRDILPPMIRRRKSKLGFSTPEANWMRGAMRPWLCNALEQPSYLGEFINCSSLPEMLRSLRAGRCSNASLSLLFRLAIFETWADIFLGGRAP